MFFLNLAMATHLSTTYRESNLRNRLAEKYFNQVTYASAPAMGAGGFTVMAGGVPSVATVPD